jgi:hypothetical protein
MDACQTDLRTIAQLVTAAALAGGLIYTAIQVSLRRRERNDENRTTISERTINHNKLILDDKRVRSVVASLEGLNVPADEAGADLYWAFRGVHLSHLNLIWQVWEIAGTPGKGKNLKLGYEGWQRFAQEIVAKKLRAAALAIGADKNKPENKAGADLWNGMSKYETAPPKLFLWLQWLADSEENS